MGNEHKPKPEGLEPDAVLIDKINSVVFANPSDQQRHYDEFINFISVLAERYKGPLHTVYTAIELVINREAQNLSDNARANLRRAQGTLQKVNLLTDDIIAYANVCCTEPAFALTDLNAVVQNVVHSLSSVISEKSLNLQCEKLPVITGDPLLLVTLFTQLFSNSVKFRRKGLKPEIHISCRLSEDGKTHIISVKDNSVGFDDTEAHNVFNTFYNINGIEQKGSGLGLSVCRTIMQKHNGNIKAAASVDEGTVIELHFPVVS